MQNPILLGSILAIEQLIEIKQNQIELKNINSVEIDNVIKVQCYIKGELFQLKYALDLLKKLENDFNNKLSEL